MAIGAAVRSLFGPWEATITDVYRSFFIDLPILVKQVGRQVPGPKAILEVGCGEGAVCELLAKHYPDASIVGIDISPRVGRLFQGDRRRVQFRCETAREHAADPSHRYDLILLCDVLHHVPWSQHMSLLEDVYQMLAPGGSVVVKDWLPLPNIAHVLCEFSDRVLTGDDVKYGRADEFRVLLRKVFGLGSIAAETRIRPWRNNLLFLVQPAGSSMSVKKACNDEPKNTMIQTEGSFVAIASGEA